ncbi:MAG TPA: hypothetical protein VN043_12780 [Rhodanobacter sp.]|nr:hypothetical protein [Rhodanobacter sp.]
MAEREFNNFLVRSGAALEGSRYTAYLAVTPRRHGFPVYFAICENRSFRDKTVAATAADKALADMIGLEPDGTPIFPEDYTGFDDDVADTPQPLHEAPDRARSSS